MIAKTKIKTNGHTLIKGNKNYELSNHLSNVLAVVQDRKLPIDDVVYSSPGVIDYYLPVYNSFGMYYAYGSPMPEKEYLRNQSFKYKFGFNGQEKDDEVSGNGNSNTAEFWQYSTRLGRRFNMDPIDQIFYSNYSVLGCNPVIMVDVLGNEFGLGKDKIEAYREKLNSRKNILDGRVLSLENKLTKARRQSKKDRLNSEISEIKREIEGFKKVLDDIKRLEESKTNIYDFISNDPSYTDGDGVTRINSDNKHFEIVFGNESAMAHEIVHAIQNLDSKCGFLVYPDTKYNVAYTYDLEDEVEAYKMSFWYSSKFENISDKESFYFKFALVIGKGEYGFITDLDINQENLLKWSLNQKGTLGNLPRVQITLQTKIRDMDYVVKKESNEFLQKYGEMTWGQFQIFIMDKTEMENYIEK